MLESDCGLGVSDIYELKTKGAAYLEFVNENCGYATLENLREKFEDKCDDIIEKAEEITGV